MCPFVEIKTMLISNSVLLIVCVTIPVILPIMLSWIITGFDSLACLRARHPADRARVDHHR